jgi:hypothetical protein
MTYRKLKKIWTREAERQMDRLDVNPLDMTANQEYKFCQRMLAMLKGMKRVQNERKKSKKAAKAA